MVADCLTDPFSELLGHTFSNVDGSQASGLSADDVKPDTDGSAFVIEADPKLNEKAGKARMFNLEQLQHLFNV